MTPSNKDKQIMIVYMTTIHIFIEYFELSFLKVRVF
jgi:hypothetical protein